jgi:hypothetical protein
VRVGDFPIVEMPCRTSLVRVEMQSRCPVEGASYELERSRGVPSSEPRTSQNVVKASRRASLVRVRTRSRRPVEGASYEVERSRGVPSSEPRTSRNTVEVFSSAILAIAGSVLFFLIVDCGYP